MPKSLKKMEIKRWNYFAMAKLYVEMQDTLKKLNRMIARSKRKLREKRLRKRRAAMMKTLKKKVMGVPRKKPKQKGGVELELSSQWFVRARTEEPIKKVATASSSSSSTSSSSSSSSDSSPSRRPNPGYVSTTSYLQLSSETEDGEE